MADQTTLPTCTPGSLGPTKLDRTTAVDPYRDESAAQANLKALCVEELFRRSGLSDGSTPASYESRVLALEAGEEDPGAYVFRDDFDRTYAGDVPDPSAWMTAGAYAAAVVTTDVARGGARFALDAATLARRTKKLWNRFQLPRVSYHVTLSHLSGTHARVNFHDVGTPASFWGVTFPSDQIIRARIAVDGGLTAEVELGGWQPGAEYLVRYEVREDLHMWVSISPQGEPAWPFVDVGAVPNITATVDIETSADGTPGGFMAIRCFRLYADWTQDPPPT
jgi:hypothetical protein